MKQPAWRSRVRAASIHLGASALVAALAAGLTFGLWYPWPYSVLAGGLGLFVLVCSVDVIMGPLITLVIFDTGKPWGELRRDLIVVVLLQLAALGYGLNVMFQARPVVLAFEGQRFRVVTAVDVLIDELPKAPPSLQSLSLTGPVVVGTEAPTDPDGQLKAIDMAFGGFDLGMRPQFWRPWDATARKNALAAAKPLGPLQQRYAARASEFDAAIGRSGRPAAQLRHLPLLSRHADWVVLLDAATGEIAGFAPFNAY